jgi:hypothetical protein
MDRMSARVTPTVLHLTGRRDTRGEPKGRSG